MDTVLHNDGGPERPRRRMGPHIHQRMEVQLVHPGYRQMHEHEFRDYCGGNNSVLKDFALDSGKVFENVE